MSGDELTHMKASAKSSLEAFVEQLGIVVEKLAAAREGGVADEDVDPPEAAERPLDDRFDREPCERVPLDENGRVMDVCRTGQRTSGLVSAG